STQYGKPALALDIVEMFRAPVVDSVVLTLLNNRMLSETDFEETLGSWRLTDAGRKIFLQKFEERLNQELTHPIFKTKVSYRRCIEVVMRLVSRWLSGELTRFREFYIKGQPVCISSLMIVRTIIGGRKAIRHCVVLASGPSTVCSSVSSLDVNLSDY